MIFILFESQYVTSY